MSEFEPSLPPEETSFPAETLLVPEAAAEQTVLKPTLKGLFVGDDGLRAGWSVALYIVLMFLVGEAIGLAVHYLHLMPASAPVAKGTVPPMLPRGALIDKVIEFCIFAIPAFVMSLIERRPFARYGLGARRMLPDFLLGLFWGLAALSLLVGALVLTHGIAFDGFALHGTVAVLYGLKWAAVFLFVGLGEEFLTRGYLQYTTARGVSGIVRAMDPTNAYSYVIGFWVAAILFSVVIFAGAHLFNPGENGVGIFQVALVGVVFAFSLWRTGSLWWAVGVHMSWDWAQSYLFGTPDSGTMAVGHLMVSHPMGSRLLSGGPDGPEGSLLGIPAVLMLGVVIYFTLPRRDYALTADQRDVGDAVLPDGSLGGL